MEQLHILIVDDDHDFLESMSEMIEAEGYKITTAHNGQEALKIFNEQDINLLLIDLKMPGMSGIDTYKEVRRIASSKLFESINEEHGMEILNILREHGFKVPVIIITAYAGTYKEQLEELQSIYTIDIVKKPFDSKVLFEKIEALR